MIKFSVNQQAGKVIARQQWQKWLKIIEKHAVKGKTGWEISLALVSDAAIKKINRLYRKINAVTDVLSFGPPKKQAKPGFLPKNYLGEIIICYPRARQQAKTARHGVNEEIQLLLTHGFLHLLGYDHEGSEKEALKMRKLEEAILTNKKLK